MELGAAGTEQRRGRGRGRDSQYTGTSAGNGKRKADSQRVVDDLGVQIRRLERPMRLRLAEGKLSGTVLDRAIRGATLSALNGEVHEKIDQALVSCPLV